MKRSILRFYVFLFKSNTFVVTFLWFFFLIFHTFPFLYVTYDCGWVLYFNSLLFRFPFQLQFCTLVESMLFFYWNHCSFTHFVDGRRLNEIYWIGFWNVFFLFHSLRRNLFVIFMIAFNAIVAFIAIIWIHVLSAAIWSTISVVIRVVALKSAWVIIISIHAILYA